MTASGLALVASPAMADDTGTAPTESVVEDTGPAAEDTIAPPAEESAAEAPVEEAAIPSEETATPSEEATVAEPTVEDQSSPPSEESTAGADASRAAGDAPASDQVQMQLIPPGDEVVDKVEICHGTSSYKNPYVINEPAADGDVSGHAGHTGPVFYAGIPKGTVWGDIIPPFYYQGSEGVQYFEGLNWDVGQAIYANDCTLPVPPEQPRMSLEVTDCFGYIAPSLTVWLSGLRGNLDYRVIVQNQDGVVDIAEVPAGSSGEGYFTWDELAGGTYTVTFEQAIIPGEWEVVQSDEFSVTDCPVLGVTAKGTACSNGDDGTAVVNLTGLIPGQEYSWYLTGPNGTTDGTLGDEVDSDALDVPFGDLPPGDYIFDVSWTWEGYSADAQATFTVDPCPPVTPVTPVTPKPAALAATGSDGTGGLLGAALVMIVLGAGALAFRGRRAVGVHED